MTTGLIGLPGLLASRSTTPRQIFKGDDGVRYLPGSTRIIDASNARDSGNTGDLGVLRAGLLMGIITASGLYAPSILGVSTGAIIATATSITVSAAQAVEIVRRVGATGTLRFVGPPTANGTVATFTETFSAVNTSTGEITISGADAALVAGSFVCANDGTYLPVTFIAEQDGVGVLDEDAAEVDVPFPRIPISGTIDSDNILPGWPTDTSLQQWICDQLCSNGRGNFSFSHRF